MTEITINESGMELISASVSTALSPKFDDLHRRVTAVATSVSNIDGRLASTATKEDLAKLDGKFATMATKEDMAAGMRSLLPYYFDGHRVHTLVKLGIPNFSDSPLLTTASANYYDAVWMYHDPYIVGRDQRSVR